MAKCTSLSPCGLTFAGESVKGGSSRNSTVLTFGHVRGGSHDPERSTSAHILAPTRQTSRPITASGVGHKTTRSGDSSGPWVGDDPVIRPTPPKSLVGNGREATRGSRSGHSARGTGVSSAACWGSPSAARRGPVLPSSGHTEAGGAVGRKTRRIGLGVVVCWAALTALSSGAVAQSSSPLPSTSRTAAALAAWSNFPVHASPRPLVLPGLGNVDGSEGRFSFHEGRSGQATHKKAPRLLGLRSRLSADRPAWGSDWLCGEPSSRDPGDPAHS